jgi:hypothetical protein
VVSTSPQYISLICDPFADPIILLHSRDISLFDCHRKRADVYLEVKKRREHIYFE